VGAAARGEPDPRAARPGAQEHAVRRGRRVPPGRLPTTCAACARRSTGRGSAA
jgi:hypothetical protein